MAKNTCKRHGLRNGGFTLIEIMLAAMILGIGLLMLLPAFTVGVVESSQMVDASLAAQTVQSGESYCLTLLQYKDTNWWSGAAVANSDSNLHAYTFASNNINIVNDSSIRVQGDANLSRYYWSLLYRVNQWDTRPVMVDLWVMACKRDVAGTGSPTPLAASGAPANAQTVQSAPLSGSAGNVNISGAPAVLCVPDTYVVTNTGEVLRVAGVNGTTLTVNPAVTTNFTSVWYVPNSGNPQQTNCCLYAICTKKAF